MRIAFLSDLHGNAEAVQAVLEALPQLHVDQIVIGGDVVDPLPGSRRVAEFLIAQNWPMIRGNHEDYVIHAATDPSSVYATASNWAPVRRVAQDIPPELLAQLASWPLAISFTDEAAGEVLLCHASPRSNQRGWRAGVDAQLATELEATSAPLIVCGHWHMTKEEQWRDKRLVMNGSVGVPLHGTPRAEFLILDSEAGHWEIERESVAFAAEKTWREYLSSGWFRAGGPMAWLVFDEIRLQQRRMGRFIEWVRTKSETSEIASLGGAAPFFKTEERLAEGVCEFLRELGTWTEIERLTGSELRWPSLS